MKKRINQISVIFVKNRSKNRSFSLTDVGRLVHKEIAKNRIDLAPLLRSLSCK